MVNSETYIYTLSNPLNGQIKYVGKTDNIEKRYLSHLSKSKNKKTYKDCWIYSLLSENVNPLIEIIDAVPKSEWQFWEKYWISQLRSWGVNLTNSTEGGDGGMITKEVIEKLSVKNKGDKNPMYGKSCRDIWVERYGEEKATEMWENKYKKMRGKKISESVKSKISEAKKNKNYRHSDEVRKKIGELSKKMWDNKNDRSLSNEHKNMISDSNKGKKHSEETKKKISEKLKGNKINLGKKRPDVIKRNQNNIGKKQSDSTKIKRSESLKKYWLSKKFSTNI